MSDTGATKSTSTDKPPAAAPAKEKAASSVVSQTINAVIQLVKPLLPEIEAMIEKEALALIGVQLPVMGQARLIAVTPKVIAKLQKNGYSPFPTTRADDPAHPEHDLPNATAYYIAMELEGETTGSNLIAGEVQGICMSDPSFIASARAAAALSIQSSESAYVAAIGTAVISTVSSYAATKAQSVFPKAGGV